MDWKHQDPNVYSTRPLDGKGHMSTVNKWQLFNLQKSLGNTNTTNQDPDTNLPIYQAKKFPINNTPLLIFCAVPYLKPK